MLLEHHKEEYDHWSDDEISEEEEDDEEEEELEELIDTELEWRKLENMRYTPLKAQPVNTKFRS